MDSPSGDSTNSSFPALFVAKCLVANRLSPGISPYTQVRCEIHPKRFTIMWGGLSSTTSSVQHPLGCKSPCWLVLRIEFLCWFSSLSLEFSCTCSLNWVLTHADGPDADSTCWSGQTVTDVSPMSADVWNTPKKLARQTLAIGWPSAWCVPTFKHASIITNTMLNYLANSFYQLTRLRTSAGSQQQLKKQALLNVIFSHVYIHVQQHCMLSLRQVIP